MMQYHLKIKDWPEHERPREKLLKHGAAYLSDAELLALLIGSGSGGVTAVDVAKQMLVEYQDLNQLASRNLNELSRMKGIGPARGAVLMAAFEIGHRLQSNGPAKKFKIQTPADLVRQYQPMLSLLRQEVFKVVLLDNGNRLIRDVDISMGILNASLVHPREVFKVAIDHMAAGIIVIHNHPGGEAKPSVEDRRVTRQLKQASDVIGIPLLDHIIITDTGFYSFADNGDL